MANFVVKAVRSVRRSDSIDTLNARVAELSSQLQASEQALLSSVPVNGDEFDQFASDTAQRGATRNQADRRVALLEADRDAISERLDAALMQIDSLAARLRMQDIHVIEFRKNAASAEEVAREAVVARDQVAGELDQVTRQRVALEESVVNLRAEQTKLEFHRSLVETEREALLTKVEQLASQLEIAQSDLRGTERVRDALDSRLQLSLQQKEELTSTLAQLRTERDRSAQETAEAGHEIVRLRQQLESLGAQNDQAKQELAQALSQGLAWLSEIETARRNLSEVEAGKDHLERDLAAANVRLETEKALGLGVLAERDALLGRIADAERVLAAEQREVALREADLSALAEEIDSATLTARQTVGEIEAERIKALAEAELALARALDQQALLNLRCKSLEDECARLSASELAIIARRDAIAAQVEEARANERTELSSAILALTAERDSAVAERDRAKTTGIERNSHVNGAAKSLTELARPRGRQFFVTFSLGRTATQWLVSVLNSHKDVLATHAFDFSPEKRPVASTGRDFIESLERQESALSRASTVDAAFDQFDNPDYRVVGNVHGIDAAAALEQSEQSKRRYHVSYLTRHPILRVRSLVNRWKYEIDLSSARRATSLQTFQNLEPYCRSFGQKYGVDFRNDHDWLFVSALAYLLPSEARHLGLGIQTVIYERLVRDPDYLLWYLNHVSGGAVEFTDEFVNGAIQRSPVDRRGNAHQLARQEFSSWSGWQRDMFADQIWRAGSKAHYDSIGYETSF